MTPHASSGPFVYRLGRQVFNLKRGVRLPYGLPFFQTFLHVSVAPCYWARFAWLDL
jgi:hypothetical protein